jgi:cytochrome c5
MIFLAVTIITFACAGHTTQNQQAATSAAPAPEPASNENAADAPYSVECGQTNDAGEPFCYVDKDTYIGWRTYHGFCHVCHAQDAVGSSFAPNLLDRMNQSDMTRDLFVKRVSEGFTGQVGVMPPWKDNPNISKRYNELYAYLRARADGALPPGRPKKKPISK